MSADSKTDSLVVIANQVFSRERQDLFLVERGQLYRCTRPESPSPQGHQAGGYQLDALADTSVYDHEIWNQILSGYSERLGQAAFSFPTQALS